MFRIIRKTKRWEQERYHFQENYILNVKTSKLKKPKKYRRLYVGNEVRLMNAYFVTCTGYDVDEDGNVTCVYATYDPESRGGNSPDGRKVRRNNPLGIS